jgi:hypothetical protein
MSIVDTVTGLISKLPVGAVTSLVTIVQQALTSGDPERYLKRLATAKAAHAASKKAAGAALDALKK